MTAYLLVDVLMARRYIDKIFRALEGSNEMVTNAFLQLIQPATPPPSQMVPLDVLQCIATRLDNIIHCLESALDHLEQRGSSLTQDPHPAVENSGKDLHD